jgi:hypothetical protein
VSSDVDPESVPLAFGRPNGSKSIPNSEEVFNIRNWLGSRRMTTTRATLSPTDFPDEAKKLEAKKKK